MNIKYVVKTLHTEKVLDNLKVEDHDFIAIIGKNGKGKTTILNILAELQRIDSGEYILDEIVVSQLLSKKTSSVPIQMAISFKIMEYVKQIHVAQKIMIILVTHDERIAEYANQIITI